MRLSRVRNLLPRRATSRVVVFGQGAAQAHDDRAGLAGGAAAVAAGPDVHLAAGVGHFQGAEDGFAVFFGGEIIVEGAAVDFDLAGARRDADAGDGGLAAADAPDVGRFGLRGCRDSRWGAGGFSNCFSRFGILFQWIIGHEYVSLNRLLRQFQFLGLLSGVGMLVALVNLELVQGCSGRACSWAAFGEPPTASAFPDAAAACVLYE